VTAKKAEEKAASGSLLAKLHYGVVQFLDEAELFLKGNSADLRDVTGKLKVSPVCRKVNHKNAPVQPFFLRRNIARCQQIFGSRHVHKGIV